MGSVQLKAHPDLEKCFNWNALHEAASSGKVDLFRELFKSNPTLVEALDSQERSLLHLASANGHVNMVATIIELRPEMCLARDRDGANPLHLAAMRGKVHVLNALFEANPHAARARVNGGERETILHLCVKYDKLDCLEELLMKFNNDEFVNAKDDAGNTILHLAVAHQKIEMIRLVLHNTGIDVNATNASKQTAMDILPPTQREGPKPLTRIESEIEDLLRKCNGKRGSGHGAFDDFDLVLLGEYFEWNNNLHKAAIKGQTDHFEKLSKTDSEPNQPSPLHYLSETLDSHQRSPLHLASAHGRVDIVDLLVKANPKICLAYDRDGLNPLHAAAVAGQVEVLDKFLEANICAVRARVDKRERETVLHLCVRHNQLNVLKKLLEHFKGDQEFVNAKDHDGNTLLHLAVANRRVEMIKLVLPKDTEKQHKLHNDTGIDVNATNASKQTAMDILPPTQREGTNNPMQTERDIEELLRKWKGKRGSDLDLTNIEFIDRKRKWLTIVAILMATIAFQAAVDPPGGVWHETSDEHRAGQSVMAYTNPHSYSNFICCNTIGFIASLLTISFLISGAYKKKISVGLLVVVMFVSITSTAFTYAYAIIVFTPKMEREFVDYTVGVAVIIWFGAQAIFVGMYGWGWMAKMCRK